MVVLYALPRNGKKGASHMVSSNFSRFLPWEDRPPRQFPAQRWVEARFGFRLPPLHLRPRLRLEWREFPAKAWLRQRQQHSG